MSPFDSSTPITTESMSERERQRRQKAAQLLGDCPSIMTMARQKIAEALMAKCQKHRKAKATQPAFDCIKAARFFAAGNGFDLEMAVAQMHEMLRAATAGTSPGKGGVPINGTGMMPAPRTAGDSALSIAV